MRGGFGSSIILESRQRRIGLVAHFARLFQDLLAEGLGDAGFIPQSPGDGHSGDIEGAGNVMEVDSFGEEIGVRVIAVRHGVMRGVRITIRRKNLSARETLQFVGHKAPGGQGTLQVTLQTD